MSCKSMCRLENQLLHNISVKDKNNALKNRLSRFEPNYGLISHLLQCVLKIDINHVTTKFIGFKLLKHRTAKSDADEAYYDDILLNEKWNTAITISKQMPKRINNKIGNGKKKKPSMFKKRDKIKLRNSIVSNPTGGR